MAKKKTIKRTTGSGLRVVQKLYAKNKRLSWAIIIAGVFCLYLLITQVRINIEKNDFGNARETLDMAYVLVKNELGAPASYRSIASCKYSSVKFGKGPLGCIVGWTAFYQSISGAEAKKTGFSLRESLKKSMAMYKPKEVNESNPLIDANHIENLTLDVRGIKYCEVSIDYQLLDNHMYVVYDIAKERQGMLISATCSDTALREYYPVDY